MKAKLILLFLLLCVGLSFKCKSLPPVQPQSDQAAAMGIQVELTQFISIMGNKAAEKVYFVKVENGNIMTKAGIINATWAKSGRAYVFNAEPGEYAAVAASYHVTSSNSSSAPMGGGATMTVTTTSFNTYTTFFPRAVVEATRVKVSPGRLSYMGSYVFDMKQGFATADDVQKFYGELMSPGSTTLTGLSGMMQTEYTGTVKSQKTKADGQGAFMTDAREDFGDTQWIKWATP